jgi:colanic acid biosynthesis glycosyl transferase WcaI
VKIQLWSYNYDPEPQGIAPLSGILARGLASRGHEVTVVSAHPHYPEPQWGRRFRPYQEWRDGILVLRMPIWAGRDTKLARLRQELSYLAPLCLMAPLLPPADVIVSATPSFPALLPAALIARMRGTPWVMWVQDIVTDGATTTGQLDEGPLLGLARWFERYTYERASSIVVISDAFRSSLLGKGVPLAKIHRIFNPLTRSAQGVSFPRDFSALEPRTLAMGNVGRTQGLEQVVRAFEQDKALESLDAKLVIAGSGVAASEVRASIETPRVEMPGVLLGEALEPELRSAALGLVSQRHGLVEFNLPSKLMNYMAYGIPVLASVDPESETARIVRDSGAGWVTDPSDLRTFATKAAEVLHRPDWLQEASNAGRAYALRHFAPERVAAAFETVLTRAVEVSYFLRTNLRGK